MLITSTNIDEIVQSISNHVNEKAALITIGEHTEIEVNNLIEQLNKVELRFMGGIFPKVIHGNSILDKGIVINTLNNLESMFLVKNISTKDYQIPEVNFDADKDYSLFTYVDGLTSNISHYLSELYENYGMQTNYFGGGAGSLTLQQKPCVFNNEGVFMDAAVFSVMTMSSRIGVKHGWSKVEGPFIVTKAEGNVIKEINWKNPYDVYKEVVEEHSGKTFTDDNFFDIAKGYPFGILKEDGECIVRDPLMVNENSELVCVGELEDNMVVDILNGNENSLINAAKTATQDSVNQAVTPSKAIIIDCISRILFLEDNFDKELTAITRTLQDNFPEVSIGGALTLGEISSYGEGFLEFYNKTVVVGLFE
ncbi:FIST N-terminal domain-containing protein [Ichthyenterobacterium sp. W332]|uniref:FIST N-terminal domain-containing protein n=1 Tax=Microcosmobacter mediterraneus TaxID=3075607 RepID=A0ABU2YME9_9FLAO|nr:FIST N-terminal domain-containing protein [Ichthyenterobacterium sp. W332]MDT0558975.1 FIST N-terminal domain-containing protein [Ichthyenterobacterium sp. W332]